MIDYACFKHKGNAENYYDEVFVSELPFFTAAVFCGKEEYINTLSCAFVLSEVLKDSKEGDQFETICAALDEKIPEDIEYLVLRIDDSLKVDSLRRGQVLACIANNGEMMTLPNGIYGLKEGDMIVCSVKNFYSNLTNEGMLADALISSDCNEWMDYMVSRVSDKTELLCGNLSAVCIKV